MMGLVVRFIRFLNAEAFSGMLETNPFLGELLIFIMNIIMETIYEWLEKISLSPAKFAIKKFSGIAHRANNS